MIGLSIDGIEVGDRAEITRRVSDQDIADFVGAVGDYNPVHTDDLFATKVGGYPGVFAHGMLTMGMTGKMLTDLVGDGRLLSFGGRFTAQVWPGDDLSSTAKVESVRDVDGEKVVDLTVATSNQDGVVVFSGQATARLDS